MKQSIQKFPIADISAQDGTDVRRSIGIAISKTGKKFGVIAVSLQGKGRARTTRSLDEINRESIQKEEELPTHASRTRIVRVHGHAHRTRTLNHEFVALDAQTKRQHKMMKRHLLFRFL